MIRTTTLLALVCIAIVLSGVTATAGPIQLGAYTFTTIANTRGPFASLFLVPTINSQGIVAFQATLDDGSKGIFTGSGGPITTIADTHGSFVDLRGQAPSINSAGTVAFTGRLPGNQGGVFTGNGGPTTTIATGPFFTTLFDLASINSAGSVAVAIATPGTAGVFVGKGGPLTTIADRTSRPIANVTSVSINDSATVAFSWMYPFSTDSVLSNGDGVSLTDVAGPPLASVNGSSINAAGAIAFKATDQTGGHGDDIFVVSGVSHTIGNLTNGAILTGSGVPAINDNGEVAFTSSVNGNEAILLNSAQLFIQVIREGDSLDGSSPGGAAVSGDLYLGERAINNSGQITFFARLADGTEGIYRADPIQQTVVPEPGTDVLMGMGLTGIVLTLHRRRRQVR